jgi:phospholipid-binding lipoprotein MlaA
MNRKLTVSLLSMALGACSSLGAPSGSDPLEPVNRAVFAFNSGVDTHVLAPVASFYKDTVPDEARQAVHNFSSNLGEPVTLVNDTLQGDLSQAKRSFYRFGINSTVGVAGLIDVAQNIEGIGPHTDDFGRTLGHYGVGSGPYLVLPLLGASSVRDAAGSAVDYFIDPLSYVTFSGKQAVRLSVSAVSAVDRRARNANTVDMLRSESADFYAAVRSSYFQHRASQIGSEIDPDALPDF